LPISFYSAASDEGLGATLDGAGVDANVFDPIEIQGHAAIGLQGAAAEVSESRVDGRKRCFEVAIDNLAGAARSAVNDGHVRISSEHGEDALTPRQILSL
jgi:hypothetical protein